MGRRVFNANAHSGLQNSTAEANRRKIPPSDVEAPERLLNNAVPMIPLQQFLLLQVLQCYDYGIGLVSNFLVYVVAPVLSLPAINPPLYYNGASFTELPTNLKFLNNEGQLIAPPGYSFVLFLNEPQSFEPFVGEWVDTEKNLQRRVVFDYEAGDCLATSPDQVRFWSDGRLQLFSPSNPSNPAYSLTWQNELNHHKVTWTRGELHQLCWDVSQRIENRAKAEKKNGCMPFGFLHILLAVPCNKIAYMFAVLELVLRMLGELKDHLRVNVHHDGGSRNKDNRFVIRLWAGTDERTTQVFRTLNGNPDFANVGNSNKKLTTRICSENQNQMNSLLTIMLGLDPSSLMKAIIEKLCGVTGRAVPHKDEEKQKMYNTLKDTFNAFDGDGSGQLGFPEYVEAWKFLNRPGGEEAIRKAFDSVDLDQSGVCDWNEFAFSFMGEAALAFGPLAELELLNELLDATPNLFTTLNEGPADSARMVEERAERNAELRNRLNSMKGEMNGEINKVIGKMMGIFGQSPEDMMTDEEFQKLLVETFKKFDNDGSGELEKPEFIKAWRFLGLGGEDTEILRAFDDVDVNRSGKIDRREFCDAIRDSRASELSLGVLVTKMDGHLDGMGDFFSSHEQHVKDKEESFDRFRAASKRRRLMKMNLEQHVAELVARLERTMHKTLRDTFNAFDKDRSAQLGFPEYIEAWKFLGQPGDDAAIKKAFDSVVDSSGLVESDKFLTSIMGEAAMGYGILADMEKLHMLGDTLSQFALLKGALGEAQGSADQRKERNARLRDRLENMKKHLGMETKKVDLIIVNGRSSPEEIPP